MPPPSFPFHLADLFFFLSLQCNGDLAPPDISPLSFYPSIPSHPTFPVREKERGTRPHSDAATERGGEEEKPTRIVAASAAAARAENEPLILSRAETLILAGG
jgi:hypothetical protein